MKENMMTLDKQARTLPFDEVLKQLDRKPKPARPLAQIYQEDIAGRGIQSQEDLDSELADELGRSAMNFAEKAVRGTFYQSAKQICSISRCLGLEDLASILSIRLVRSAVLAKEAPNFFLVCEHTLISMFKSVYKNKGKEVKDPDAQPDGERHYEGGYQICSSDEKRDEDGPALDWPDDGPSPEERYLFQQNALDAFRIIQQQKLSERQMAAFFREACVKGLQPAVAEIWRKAFLSQLQAEGADSAVCDAWTSSFGAGFSNARAKTNALYLARKKIEKVKTEIYYALDVVQKIA